MAARREDNPPGFPYHPTCRAKCRINLVNRNTMPNELPSLITPDAQAGLALAAKLAGQLLAQVEAAGEQIPRPGGMNYLMPKLFPKEATAAILFYAIAAANRGWPA